MSTRYETPSERARREIPVPDDFAGSTSYRHAIWDSTMSPTCKLLALAMLERANEYGVFDDPARVLLEMTGFTARGKFAEWMREIESAGLIQLLHSSDGGPGLPNHWRLVVPS